MERKRHEIHNIDCYCSHISTPFSRWGGNLDSSSGSPITLGFARPSGSRWGDFDGKIDELYLFDRALTAQEVSNLQQFNSLEAAVPEPASILLLALAFCGMGWRLRRGA